MNMFPIWVFLLLTLGAPLLWALLDYRHAHQETLNGVDRSMHLRAGMPDLTGQ